MENDRQSVQNTEKIQTSGRHAQRSYLIRNQVIKTKQCP